MSSLRARRLPARAAWLVVPVLVGGLLAVPVFAGPAAAVDSSPSDCIFFGLICSPPASTPAPTPAPTSSPGATPTVPALPTVPPLPAPTPSASAPALPNAADACKQASFPPAGSTSNQAKFEYAGQLGRCQQAVASGDAKVAVDAADPAALPLVSTSLSRIKASRMTMDGLTYDGLATLQSAAGPVTVLQFGADKLQVEGMDETYPFSGGTVRFQNTRGTAILQGHLKLYVTRMTAKIFGLIELTFDPGFQPPLVLPSMFFTDATTDVALVRCDQILLPALKAPVTGG